MRCYVAAFIIASASSAGDLMGLGVPLPVPAASDEWLRYDDEAACWLTWQGEYRGVWFDGDDFWGPGGCETDCTEFWFYHDDGYPWDTSAFFAEIYGGGASGPLDMFDQSTVTASHYAPVLVDYPTPVPCGNDFWIVVHTGMSSGGWPSLLGDGTPGAEFHSYFSSDGTLWQSWGEGDFIIRTHGGMAGLEAETWGSIKALLD